MAGGLQLDDGALALARRALVSASDVMVSGNARMPAETLPSLSGIGARVDLHLRGLAVARTALADAASTAGAAVASVMRESSELDAAIAGSLPEGFAVKVKGTGS